MSKQPPLTTDISREEKLESIYEVVGYKQKYFRNGCPRCGIQVFSESCGTARTSYERLCCKDCGELTYDEEENIEEKEYERVLPVMIGDVLDYIQSEEILRDGIGYLLMYRSQKRESVEYQSDECIDYIYSLLS